MFSTSSTIDLQISELSSGELRNFHELYLNYRKLIRGVLYKLVPLCEIEDLVQDVFIKIWKGLPRFEGKSSFKLWIYQITYHSAVDFLRKKKISFTEIDKIDLPNQSASTETHREHQQIVRKMLLDFDLNHRSVIVLFFMEELSLIEIAQILDIPVGTVKSRLHYAKQKMFEKLKQEGITL